MKKYYFLCFVISFLSGIIIAYQPTPKIAAYIRVKNEIKTIIPCLDSIDGLFDKIVIIHSNEPDDGSVAAMKKWCKWRLNCHIYEYPHAVMPSHTTNQQKIKYENSLAAYYNFGLEKFDPDEYVAKIDADQIYIKPKLKEMLDFIRMQDKTDDFIFYGVLGYNTFEYKGKLVKYANRPINGGFDHFIVKRKYIKNFVNFVYYENLEYLPNLKRHLTKTPSWFHFMKTFKKGFKQYPLDTLNPHETQLLSPFEKQEFEQYIRPLLKKHNSVYKNISL